MAKKIYIHSEEEYLGFRNTSPHPVEFENRTYRTAENLFQALKFLKKDDEKAKEFEECENPLEKAYEVVGTADQDDLKRSDWFEVNKTMLKIALHCKFDRHEDLRGKLVATDGRELVNNVTDRFWGIGEDHNGKNQFGKVLMEVREDIKYGRSTPLLEGLPGSYEFYDKGKPSYIFTNFAPVSVTLRQKTWKTSEHLFQAWKFSGNPDIVRQIHEADTPRDVFNIAHQNINSVRTDWREISIPVMRFILHLKFTGNPEAKKLLRSTIGYEMIEASQDDNFWGWGPERRGRNELGKALVRVRNIIEYKLDPPVEPPGPPC